MCSLSAQHSGPLVLIPASITPRSPVAARLLIACMTMGATALVAQVVLTRELLSLFYGNELSVALVLAMWLVTVGAGSVLGSRLARRFQVPARAFGWSQAMIAGLMPAAVAIARWVQPATVGPAQVLGPGAMLLVSLEVLMPICLVVGFQFVIATRSAVPWRPPENGSAASAVAAVYALESAGAVLGGVVFHFWFAQHATPFQTLATFGLLNLVSAFLLLRPGLSLASRRMVLASISLLGSALMLLLVSGNQVEIAALRVSPRWSNLNPVALACSKHGAVVLAEQAGQVSFYQNGVLLFTSQDEYANEVAVHLLLLEHPRPRRVLVIGGGIAGLAAEVLEHPVTWLDCVELDPRVQQLAARWLPTSLSRVLRDSRLHLHTGDGRRFVRGVRGRYDAIIVDLPDPTTAALNRFYTAGFFREASAALTPTGLLAISLTGSEVQFSGAVGLAAATTDRTLAAVFADRLIVPGERMLFLGAKQSGVLTSDWRVLAKRLQLRGLQADFVNEVWLRDSLLPFRADLVRTAINSVADPRVNTDLNPISYYQQTRIWLHQLSPTLAAPARFLSRVSVWWALAFPALAALTAVLTRGRRREAAAVLFAAAAMGGFGLVAEVLALLTLQSSSGYLYYALAALMASFMAGLALGAALLGRRELDRTGRWRLLILVLCTATAACLLQPALLQALLARPGLAPAVLGLVLLWAGFLVGATFPISVALYSREREASVAGGVIYAADLLGSAGAAVVAGVVAVPVLGVAGTSFATALYLGAALVLVLPNVRG